MWLLFNVSGGKIILQKFVGKTADGQLKESLETVLFRLSQFEFTETVRSDRFISTRSRATIMFAIHNHVHKLNKEMQTLAC